MYQRQYHKVLKELTQNGTIDQESKVLVVCGSDLDRNILLDLKFANVTISNIDERIDDDRFAPYHWNYQDAEGLSYGDCEFDWVFVHAGLHHCFSPHKALVEMLRVAKKGAAIFESRDSLLVRLAVWLGLVSKYEKEAVIGNCYRYGGVANTALPNYVYRWNEREVSKIVSTFWPQYADNKVLFFYNMRYPMKRVKTYGSDLKVALLHILRLPTQILRLFFPKQTNEFGFVIIKGKTPHPWIEYVKGNFRLKQTKE